MNATEREALIQAVDVALPGCHRVCCGEDRRTVATAAVDAIYATLTRTTLLYDLRALSQVATPGPWRYDPTKVNSVDRGEAVFAGQPGRAAVTVASTGPAADAASMADAEFIAAAVNHVRAVMAASDVSS